MDTNELRKNYAALIKQAQDRAAEWKGKEHEMPEEISNEIDGYLGKADELKVKIAMADRIAAGAEYAGKEQPTAAAHLGWRQSGPNEGLMEVDPQSWREMTVKTWVTDPTSGVILPLDRKVRYYVPLAVSKKEYTPAFEAYLRKGLSDMGPNDRKTLSEGIDSAGGFTVSEDYHTELIRKIATNATIRANARTVSTSRDVAKWPKLVHTTDDKYTSGVRFTWTGETPASSTVHRATDPVFGLYTIPVHTAMASLPLTNVLLEDSAFDVASLSSDLLAEAFTLGENDTFLNGNGITRPMGILAQVDGDGPASVKSGTAATLTADGIIDLCYALPAQYEARARWVMNKGTEKVIRKMKDLDNNYLWPVWPQGGNFAAAPRSLLDYPVMKDEFMPDVGANNYPIIFGDLMGYLILDRVGLSIQRLSELYAETDITVLLARKRVGGQVVEPWRLKVQKVSA